MEWTAHIDPRFTVVDLDDALDAALRKVEEEADDLDTWWVIIGRPGELRLAGGREFLAACEQPGRAGAWLWEIAHDFEPAVAVDTESGTAPGPGAVRMVALQGGVPVGTVPVPERGATRGRARGRTRGRRMETAPPARPEPRWLQAQVHAEAAGRRARRRQAFLAHATHVITVRIAPEAEDWIQAEEEFPEPPPQDRPYVLQVMFDAPGLLEEPQLDSLELPPEGESTACEFRLPVAEEPVEATITVSFRNNHLQSAVLRGPVSAGRDEAPAGADPIRLGRGAAAGADLGFLEQQTPPDVLIDHFGDDVLVQVGDRPSRLSLRGVHAQVDDLRNRLFNAALAAAGSGGEVATEANRTLLVTLARQGRFLYDQLFRDRLGGASFGRMQVVSRHSGDLLPIELIYDRPSPADDAQICPAYLAAAPGTEECPDCRATGEPPAPFVCPLGFWALARVIERKIDPEIPDHTKPLTISLPSEAASSLRTITSVALAADERVGAADPNALPDAEQRLAAATLGNCVRARSWDEWKQDVENRSPPLLVVVPHNEVDDSGFDALQIGTDSKLAVDRVTADYVQVPAGEVGPIVLLLGCDTAMPEREYQDFVAAFRNGNAAVVVGTITKVLGRQAAPLAVATAEALVGAAEAGERTFGAVLREVRETMFRRGNPMALALAAYGDGNWRVGRG